MDTVSAVPGLGSLLTPLRPHPCEWGQEGWLGLSHQADYLARLQSPAAVPGSEGHLSPSPSAQGRPPSSRPKDHMPF